MYKIFRFLLASLFTLTFSFMLNSHNIFSTENTPPDEPNYFLILSKGVISKIDFKSLKKIELKTVNTHPNFIDKGLISYQGYNTNDIVGKYLSKAESNITILGGTGKYSVEISKEALFNNSNIVAIEMQNERIKNSLGGNSIIYSLQTQEKFPNIKNRNYWCWWVRMFILDQEGVSIHLSGVKKGKTSEYINKIPFPFPFPYGISSLKEYPPVNKIKLTEVGFNGNAGKLTITLLNDKVITLEVNKDYKYFVNASTLPAKQGLNILYVSKINPVSGKENKSEAEIQEIVDSYFYIKSLDWKP